MDRLRVLTLNIWNRQGPWDQRLALLRAGIQTLQPDVIGLQEVLISSDTSQAREIADGLGYEHVFGCAHDLGGGMEFGNAVLSRSPITSSRVFPIPAGTSGEHRSLLLAEIATPAGLLPFFVTHLSWRLHHGHIREEQVLAIAAIVKKEAPIRRPGNPLPAVLVGDFNAEPDATEIRFLKGLHALKETSTYFGDCFGQLGEGPGVTFDATRNPFAAPTHEPPRRIDYVFVRGPDSAGRGKPFSARVVFDEVHEGIAATDHYGVLAELRV